MFPYENLPDIHRFCHEQLDELHREGGDEAPELRARLETAVHALRALDPETWGQAEEDVRHVAGRFAAHPGYAALGLDDDE
ncbi:hypothetical protein ACFOVU_13955 [Nocardiopsis sediminis]|uniref:Uncharacterized protein n=1 Tax=Nocardiopsis sediminis TaxID=1778267 RepID=A0ABV8FQ88_9ACTN